MNLSSNISKSPVNMMYSENIRLSKKSVQKILVATKNRIRDIGGMKQIGSQIVLNQIMKSCSHVTDNICPGFLTAACVSMTTAFLFGEVQHV